MCERLATTVSLFLLMTLAPGALAATASDAPPGAPCTAGATTEEESTPKEPVLIERMRVISESVDRTPGSVSYIDEAALERHHSTDIHRVLSVVPGVNLQEEDGYGLRPNIGLRGSGSERSQKITLLEDGVLIAPAPYAAPSAYYFPTTGRMSGIEVRKGSSSIRQGPYTNGGVLNLLSSPIPGSFSGDLDVSGGSDGMLRGRGRVGGSSERFGWLLETFRQQADGFKQLDGGGSTGFDLSDYMVKLRYNTGAGSSRYQSLELKLGRTDQQSHETYVGLTDADFAATPYRRYAGSSQDRFDSDHDQVQLLHLARLSRVFDIQTAVYRNTFFRNWNKLQSVAGAGTAAILGDPGAYGTELGYLRGELDSPDDALMLRNNRRSYRSQGVQSVLGVHAGPRHDVEVGLRYHEDYEDRFQEEDGYRMVGSRMEQTSTGAPGSQSNRISDARAVAFFVRDTIQRGRWTMSPGIRMESIDYSRRDFGKTDPERTGFALSTRENDVRQWIPGFGAVYAFDGRSSMFAGVHRGFAPPGPGATVEVDPEESVNYEVGYRRGTGPTAFEGTLYFNDYRNLLGADTLSSGGTGEGEVHNGGEADVYGFEGAYRHDFAVAGARLRAPVSLTYTYTHAEFRSSFDSDFAGWGDRVEVGDELPYVAPHAVALQGGLVGSTWSSYATVTWTDSMRTQAGQGAVAANETTDAHLLVDVTVKRQFDGGIQAFVQARNLTDEVYRAALRPSGARPGMPRSITAGLTWSF